MDLFRTIMSSFLDVASRVRPSDSLQDLYEIYTVCGVGPRTSILEAFTQQQGTEADRLLGSDRAKGGVTAKEGEEDDVEEETPATGKASKAAAQWAMIVRPDIDSMAAFHPELSTLYHPDSLQQTGPGDGSFMEAAAAREVPMFAPPKILCDILALLPKANGKLCKFLPAAVKYIKLPIKKAPKEDSRELI